jgi:hypothetical protein
MAKLGDIRRNQLITTYGVGALVAIRNSSFMVAGLDRWDAPIDARIHEPRLEHRLGVEGFVVPPAENRGHDVPVVRFPWTHYCPECRRLASHNFFTGFDSDECSKCGQKLVPSRFIVCCSRGHIDDFPYFEWVHSGASVAGDKHELSIETKGASASLRDIIIRCSCGSSRSMDGAFGKRALGGVALCRGRRLWLGTTANEDCRELPRTVQRGASNVWFPLVASSISIPPWSEGAFALLDRHWSMLQHIPEIALRPTLEGMRLTEGTPYTVDDLIKAIQQRLKGEGLPEGADELKRQEYEALLIGRSERSRVDQFVCTPAPVIASQVADWFDRVMLVKRLREVRALLAFTRLLPPDPDDNTTHPAKLFVNDPRWRPATEVTGEGVFLRLRKDRLTDWEHRPDVLERTKRVQRNAEARTGAVGGMGVRKVTPRFLLTHTLAHALIAQWSLDCGYPAASLRERLYVDDEMCGLMIYTATSDSAGSLGGVVAQANPDRLAGSLVEAIGRMGWCSSDPLCIETDAQGVDGLNLAACHACALLPEVSCEELNVYLDRGLLIGTPSNPQLGLFHVLVGE